MREHIEQTIKDIQESVDKGLQLIEDLKGFEEGYAQTVVALPRVNPNAPAPAIAAESVKGVKGANGNGKNRATPPRMNKAPGAPIANGLGKRVMIVAAGMDEPFDFDQVHALLKDSSTTRDSVRGALGYGIKKGEVITVSEGAPGKPAKLRLSAAAKKKYSAMHPTALITPGVAQADEQSRCGELQAARETRPAAPVYSKRADLEQKLEAAMKKRDHERGAGREQMAEVYQREIDGLLLQLGDLK